MIRDAILGDDLLRRGGRDRRRRAARAIEIWHGLGRRISGLVGVAATPATQRWSDKLTRLCSASGGIHQVKPWFAGRLDFAPVLSFGGDDEFPLEGGAVGLFVDRKAATFLFKHRLHTASLFVFRSEGLGWPLRNDTSVGALPASSSTSRGFNVLLWRDGDLGYDLVSDVDRSELARLAAKVVAR